MTAPQKKVYHDSGILSRNKDHAQNPNFSEYRGSLQATCCHCGRETLFWMDANVKGQTEANGGKGKFFAIRIRPKAMDQQSGAVVPPPQGRAQGPSNPPPGARPAARPAPAPSAPMAAATESGSAPPPPASNDDEYRF